MSLKRNKAPGGVIAALYARGLLDYLRSQGMDPNRLYPHQRVEELEQAQGHAEIPLAEWVAMFPPAVEALRDPALPLRAGASLDVRHLGILGQVLTHCDTLGEVYRQLARYIRLLGRIGQPALEISGSHAHLIWQWPFDSPPVPAVAQFMLGARAGFMRRLSGRDDLRVDAHFFFPQPADTHAYRRIFGGEVRFGEPVSKLVLPAEYLRLPVVTADDESRRRVQEQAESLLREIADAPPMLYDLRAVIARRLAHGRVSLNEVASVLGMSGRTLQRRLASAGYAYQQLLDEVRLARAEQLLRDPELSLTQVTFLLGYTEQSTFHNAFRRWTGYAPGQYRRRMRADH